MFVEFGLCLHVGIVDINLSNYSLFCQWNSRSLGGVWRGLRKSWTSLFRGVMIVGCFVHF